MNNQLTAEQTQEWLGAVTQRNLYLDNILTGEHFCFIVTKTDMEIEVANYIKSHPPVERDLQDVIHRDESLEQIERMEKALLSTFLERKEERSREYKQLSQALDGLEPPFPRKRKFNDSDLDAGMTLRPTSACRYRMLTYSEDGQVLTSEEKARLAQYRDLKDKATKVMIEKDRARDIIDLINEGCKLVQDDLVDLKSEKMAACIESRNQFHRKTLQEGFNNDLKALRHASSGRPLRVFCVSALAYDHIQKRERISGFFEEEDTGIPALERWLVETTLPVRLANALSFLKECNELESQIKYWAADTRIEIQLSAFEASTIHESFQQQGATLKQVSSISAYNIHLVPTGGADIRIGLVRSQHSDGYQLQRMGLRQYIPSQLIDSN